MELSSPPQMAAIEAKPTSFGTGAEWIGSPPPAALAADAHPLLSAVFVAISRKTAAALLSKPRPRVENSRARTIACSRGALPAVASVASQAAYEGSIPFARSNYFKYLAHRAVLAPGKIPS